MYHRTSWSWSNCGFVYNRLRNPMGNPIAPVVKISSNTALINRMSDIIDVNAGTVITGEKASRKWAKRS
jgi:altronate dehydratase